MLINFSIENYKSYKESQRFTMIPGKYRNKKDHVLVTPNANILRLSTIYGANASGKSNLVEAIARCRYMITHGTVDDAFSKQIRQPLSYKLDEQFVNLPSKFEFEILIENRIFAYGIAVNFLDDEIFREYLYEIGGKSEKLIFDFDRVENECVVNLKKVNSDNQTRIKVYRDDFAEKKNLFFLKFISDLKFSNDDFFDDVQKVFNWFKRTLHVLSPSSSLNLNDIFDEQNNSKFVSLIEILKSFDTGISNAVQEKISLDEFIQNIKARLLPTADNFIGQLIERLNKLQKGEEVSVYIEGEAYKAMRPQKDVIIEIRQFEHCNKVGIKFSFSEESDGTQRLIELIDMLYSVQFSDHVYVVDEINRSFHPNMTIDFIKKFIQLSANTQSQLIVTNHDAALMDLNVVRQDEIWLVDRGVDGSSKLVSLSKYSVSDAKAINKDYLFGRYGGVPQIYKILNK